MVDQKFLFKVEVASEYAEYNLWQTFTVKRMTGDPEFIELFNSLAAPNTLLLHTNQPKEGSLIPSQVPDNMKDSEDQIVDISKVQSTFSYIGCFKKSNLRLIIFTTFLIQDSQDDIFVLDPVSNDTAIDQSNDLSYKAIPMDMVKNGSKDTNEKLTCALSAKSMVSEAVNIIVKKEKNP